MFRGCTFGEGCQDVLQVRVVCAFCAFTCPVSVTVGESGVTVSESGVTAGETGVTAGETGVTAGESCVTAGESGVTAGETGVTAGETGVTVGESGFCFCTCLCDVFRAPAPFFVDSTIMFLCICLNH